MTDDARDAEAWRLLTEGLEMAGVDLEMLEWFRELTGKRDAFAGQEWGKAHSVMTSLHDALARRAQA